MHKSECTLDLSSFSKLSSEGVLTGNFCSCAADKHGQITWNNQSTKPNASKYV